jgi:hypothetical protein
MVLYINSETPVIRFWYSRDAYELTAEHTGISQDLCPLPDTPDYPYITRLKKDAQNSKKANILVFTKTGLSKSQIEQMENIADLNIGLYVIAYEDLAEIRSKSDVSLLEKTEILEKSAVHWRKNSDTPKNAMGDTVNLHKFILVYNYKIIFDLMNDINALNNTTIPTDQGVVYADLDVDVSKIGQKSDELTPGMVLLNRYMKPSNFETGIMGVTKPQCEFIRKTLDQCSTLYDDIGKTLGQCSTLYDENCLGIVSDLAFNEIIEQDWNINKDILDYNNEKSEQKKKGDSALLNQYIFCFGKSEKKELFPYEETAASKHINKCDDEGCSTWQKNMNKVIRDAYHNKNTAQSMPCNLESAYSITANPNPIQGRSVKEC